MAKKKAQHEDLLDEIVDKVIDGTQTAEDLLGEGGLKLRIDL
jgi:hypothetical protein